MSKSTSLTTLTSSTSSTRPSLGSDIKSAFMSEITRCFVQKILQLVQTRNIFCSTEYPYGFTGQEAVGVLSDIVGYDWSRKEYKRMARSIMHSSVPPLFYPVTYSDKSLKTNTLYDSDKEAYTLCEEYVYYDTRQYPQGLFTQLTHCYSPLCTRGNTLECYAPTCPNKRPVLSQSTIIHKELHRNLSLTSSVASSQDTFSSRCWSNTIPREILQKTSPKEAKRQEAIFELIYTEEDYVRDLNLLDELFAKPLLTAQCIEPEIRHSFCQSVFGNYSDIMHLHRIMYRELRDHQLASLPDTGFVDDISTIMLSYVDRFMKIYTTYGPHFVLAEYTVKKEMTHNMLFQNFVREKEKQAETRKLPFRHFMILPITRLQRYPLLLSAILKRTSVDSQKHQLTQCIDTIKQVAIRMDVLTLEAKGVLRVHQIKDQIRFKPGRPVMDLDLDGRQLIYEGIMKRRSHLEWVELYVFLFDHLLLMTKPKRSLETDHIEAYVISKAPIPLALLAVNHVSENFILSTFRTNSSRSMPSTDPAIHRSSLLIRHFGKHGGEYVVYTDNPSVWKEKITITQQRWLAKDQSHHVFRVMPISDTPSVKATCAASFLSAKGGTNMIVIGTQQGIWIGKEGDPHRLKQVLMIPDVTQIGVLQAHNVLLVLADKVLTAYYLAQLDPFNLTHVLHPSSAKHLTTKYSYRVVSNHVSFFHTGTNNGRTLVITMRKKGSDSQFKAYEPVCGDLMDKKNAKYLVTKTSFISKPPAWFKLYKEFYVGTEATAVHFLKTKLLITCRRGLEVLDLEDLSQVGHHLPDLQKREFGFVIMAEACPLGLFRFNEKFLMCYDKFAFLIDSHGDLVRDQYERMEWEGIPQTVAYYYPYVIGFDANFIEVRHVETGKLIQIILGDNMRHLPCSLQEANQTHLNIYASSSHLIKVDHHPVFKLEPLFS
ncbi:CNH domain-containing protein [Gilbertella persicaria]|uniref:CNH domain-containing protein n=1 Tax=Gilbertella persicaria TaxID=101096 RepID=UPI002220E359|nr:CNH domain-containing protein [Gilbertella persicaria]KAI8091144.1 CNH domain-containing protein [Gilbertella persicaria]